MKISEIFSGRPGERRSAAEERCYALLDSLGIKYFRVDHDTAPTMEALEPVEAGLGCKICKNLFLTNRQQTDFYLLLMPGSKPFKTKHLSSQLGCSRLSFADEEHLLNYLGVTPGSASILGLINDTAGKVKLVIDRELLEDECFACHPCLNSSTLKLTMSDMQRILIPALGHEPVYVSLPRD